MASESFKQKSGCHIIMDTLKKRKKEKKKMDREEDAYLLCMRYLVYNKI